jgi:ribosome-associated heat shock protein Hsp15
MDEVRVDKWLWAARVFKSRTLAARACVGGKVDVNDQAVKPSRSVRSGDLLRVTLPHGKKILRVLALAERRGSAPDAALLFEDLSPPPEPRAKRVPPPVYRPPGLGRPTKRDRRRLDRLSSSERAGR